MNHRSALIILAVFACEADGTAIDAAADSTMDAIAMDATTDAMDATRDATDAITPALIIDLIPSPDPDDLHRWSREFVLDDDVPLVELYGRSTEPFVRFDDVLTLYEDGVLLAHGTLSSDGTALRLEIPGFTLAAHRCYRVDFWTRFGPATVTLAVASVTTFNFTCDLEGTGGSPLKEETLWNSLQKAPLFAT